MESDVLWYGLPMPNSFTRSIDASLPDVLGLTRLVRGGGGLDVSGPKDGRRALLTLEGFRASLSGRGPGADGVRIGAYTGSFRRGKVPVRLSAVGGSGA
jgi:hypothetical protein